VIFRFGWIAAGFKTRARDLCMKVEPGSRCGGIRTVFDGFGGVQSLNNQRNRNLRLCIRRRVRLHYREMQRDRMTGFPKPRRILWYENLGFLAIIVLSWLDELAGLPRLVFGGDTRVNWRESAMETILVVIVWGLVHFATKKLLDRLHYLEGFQRICSWCKKVAYHDEWLPIEEYFERGFSVRTSHGICPACAKKMDESIPDSSR
jgi:hypothetical protein